MRLPLRSSLLGLLAVSAAALGVWAAAPSGLARAIESQRSLVAKDSGNAAAKVDLGNLLVLAGDTAGGEAAYREALKQDPKNAAGHFNLGLLLERNGSRVAALREFRQVVKLDAHHAWAHYHIGAIAEGWGLTDMAVRNYAAAFRLDPSLRFPDINPSVIDNHLLTQSLLAAYRNYSAEAEPQLQFQDRSRIAALLIDRPGMAHEPVGAAANSAVAAAPSPTAGAGMPRPYGTTVPGNAAAPGAPEGAQPPSFVRVLTPQDLEPVSAPGGGVIPGGNVRNPYAITNDPRAPLYPPTYVAPQRPQGYPAGTPYYPGVPSTGKLEHRLLNAEPTFAPAG